VPKRSGRPRAIATQPNDREVDDGEEVEESEESEEGQEGEILKLVFQFQNPSH